MIVPFFWPLSANKSQKRRPKRYRAPFALLILGLLIVPAVSGLAMGQEARSGEEQEGTEAKEQEDEEPVLFERVLVVGSRDKASKIPGSVTYIDEEELGRQEYSDVHRILSQVPGVNLQEEEGFGLRPNIGMRGSGAERSQKITVMEDGVLIAPAPYSAPSAYYFPTVARMAGVEVRKGSSSIQQGPFSNGGVLNFISSSIPSSLSGTANLALGENGTHRGRVKIGDSYERFGWLVESFQLETDGFKELDGGGPTGFDLEDYLIKFRVNSSNQANRFQALEIKLGKTEQSGEETYLGLTDTDFRLNPYRRYSASQEDGIDTDHEQFQLRYFLRPNSTIDLTATAYRNDFFRNWRKLQSVDGISITEVLDDPATFNHELDILRADVDSLPDALSVRNNRRDYYSRGLHAVLGIHPGGPGSRHEIEVGLRYHEDQEDRFQEEDRFQMVSGGMVLSTFGAPGSQANRISGARAWALFAQDTISLNRWTISPGMRVELIDFTRLDYGKNDPLRTGAQMTRKENDVDVVIPGIGVSYELGPVSSLFAGVHRGFAPPGPGADDRTDPEESVNYEFGFRHSDGLLDIQLVGFFNQYDNLLGSDTLSSGGNGSGDQFNGGEVDVGGIEAGVTYDLGRAKNSPLGVPLSLSYTYTHGQFQNTFDSEFKPWGQITAGDGLPYLPAHQASMGAGLVHSTWSAFLNLSYVDKMRTAAGQGPIPSHEATDSHLLVDLSLNYYMRSKLKLFAQVRNLTDQVYVAARRPAGARPGLRRTLLAGIALDF